VSYEKRFSEEADTTPPRGLLTSLEAFFMIDKTVLLAIQKQIAAALKNSFSL
jgi:hypothetical protein